jgi:hypothetical protein
MDPESAAFQPRDDFWRMQDEMLRMHQSQQELADRVSRLERRNEDDSRLKNVWGGASPFPSVLGGTPQQGATPVQFRVLFGPHIVLPWGAWVTMRDPIFDVGLYDPS